jgi:WD40 repeat protein
MREEFALLQSRRELLTEFGRAALLSTTAVTGLSAAALCAGVPAAARRTRPLKVVVRDCVFTPQGDACLANCWIEPRDTKQPNLSLVVEIDWSTDTPRIALVPTPFSPQGVVATPGGEMLILDAQGITSGRFVQGRWQAADRALLTKKIWSIATATEGDTLFLADGTLLAVDLATKQLRWQREGLSPTALAAGGPGSLICGSESGEILELSSADGCVLRTIRRSPVGIAALAVSLDYGLLAAFTCLGQLEVCSLRSGRVRWSRASHGMAGLPRIVRSRQLCKSLCFSPTAHELMSAACEGEWNLAAWDQGTGERLQTMIGHRAAIHGFQYLPDGDLLSWGADGTLRRWDTVYGFARRVVSIPEQIARAMGNDETPA